MELVGVSVPVRDFLKRRRDRAVGSILGYAEREIFPRLDTETQQAFRRVVLDATNSYHDSVLDLVKAEDGSVARNEEVLAVLERLEGRIAQQQRGRAVTNAIPSG